jgi:hypothetical protein
MKPHIQDKQSAPANHCAEALTNMDSLIDRRDEGIHRSKEIKGELGAVYMERQRLETATRSKEAVIRGMQERLAKTPKDEQSYLVREMQSLTTELRQAEDDFAQTKVRIKALDDELLHLETVDLPSCMVALCAEDVLEHLRQIDAVKSEVELIQSAINAQLKLVEDAQATIPSAIDRQHERNSIMAEIALGKATEDALHTIDAEIAKNQKAIADATSKAAPKIEKAQATADGLAKKLGNTQKSLTMLESKSGEVAHRYYVGEAENVAVQYVNYALKLKVMYFRLLGLNSVITRHDGVGIVRLRIKPIQLPMFRLPQFDGLDGVIPNSPDMLMDGNFIHGDQIQKAAKAAESGLNAVLQGKRL